MSVTTALAAISSTLNTIVFPASSGFSTWAINLPQPPDMTITEWAIPGAFCYKKPGGHDVWERSATSYYAEHNYEVEVVYLAGRHYEAPSLLFARTQDISDAVFDCLYKDVTLGGVVNSIGYFNSLKLATNQDNYLKIGDAVLYGGKLTFMVQEEKIGVPN